MVFGIAFALVLILGLPAVARGDVVELTTGERLVGEVKHSTATTLVITVRGKDVRVAQKLVRAITFGDDTAIETARPIAPAPKVGARIPAPARPSVAATPGRPPAPATPVLGTPAPAPPASEPVAPPPPPIAAAPPPPPPPRPLSSQVLAALALLDKLQAATEKTPAPADYAARVDEVRREVEDAMAAAPDEADVRKALAAAVHYHEFAAFAGAVYEERGDFALIGRDPVINECRALSEQIVREASRLRMNPADPAWAGLFVATEGAPPLRFCAGEKIAEAESRARAPR